MAAKKFIVELDDTERARLAAFISKGKAPAEAILKGRFLLKADQAEGRFRPRASTGAPAPLGT